MGSVEVKRDVSITKQFLAEAQISAGEQDAALINLRAAVSSNEKDVEAGDANIQTKDDLAFNLVNIGKILMAKGDLATAVESFHRALPIIEEILQKTPFHIKYKSRHAISFFEAGKTFAKISRTENQEMSHAIRNESCSYFKRSSDIWNELRQAGKLSVIYANRPEETAKELANGR